MRKARISDGYRLATSAFTTRCSCARSKQVQRRALMRILSLGVMRRKRRVRMQVRAHQQRVDDAGRRSRVREPLVAARRHAGQREGSAAEQAGQRGDFHHVRRCITTDAFGILEERRVHQVAANELAIRRRDAQVLALRP